MYKKEQSYNPPVKEGEVFNLGIEGIGSKGDPFGKISNYIVFVSGSSDLKVGDKVSVVITRVTDKQAFSEINVN